MSLTPQQELKDMLERLEKVVYVEPKNGRSLDGIKILLDDARWLARQLQIALDDIDRLTPKEAA